VNQPHDAVESEEEQASMQERQARQLRQGWGDKECAHLAFDHLTLGNIHDGYLCIRCGQEFTQAQRDQLLARRKAETAKTIQSVG